MHAVHFTSIYIHSLSEIVMYVVDGGWSSWTQGTCSKICGGGIMRFNRTCNNPSPKCNGLNCRGISFREEACNEFCCRGKFYDKINQKV